MFKELSLLMTLMLIGLGLFQPAACSADVYLVAVGVADYPGTEKDLNLPTDDATDLFNLYSKNTRTHGKLLLNEQATLKNIENAMNSIYRQAKTDDIVIFYFSGHGNEGAFNAYDGPLSYKKIRNAFAASNCKHKMIFADACHAGRLRQSGKNKKNTNRDLEVMLFLSSRDNENSAERSNMKNGMFTAYLLQALKGGADTNSDRVITAKELFQFVSKNVRKKTNDKQHPVMWGKFSDDMPVMKW